MLTNQHVQDLLALIRRRYPTWDGFTHPGFVADELVYKRVAVAQAQEQLSLAVCNSLVASGECEEFLARVEKLAQGNHLLWRRVPSVGDTAVLHHPTLDKPTFCTQLRNLLYADPPSPARLQTFSDYLQNHNLPNKWPFPTYFLFLCHPQQELLVRSEPITWFLQFMGVPQRVGSVPEAAVYATILQQAKQLLHALLSFGAEDMVDVQSFIWVCAKEGKERIGRLRPKAQVELGVPAVDTSSPVVYSIPTESTVIREVNPEYTAPNQPVNPVYGLAELVQEIGFPEKEVRRWLQAIERKGQAVFYGPPGTGKTFVAKKVAQHLISDQDGFVDLVQFHPAYAYEDFMQGLRPVSRADGSLSYPLIPGRFLEFCARARTRTGSCVLIIDEINRANLSSVFGELMYLLEYRQQEIPLSGGGRFAIPANVRILGTMNTADRSIALVDHALRRRFAFIHLPPNYELLRRFLAENSYHPAGLIHLLQQLNRQIGDPHYAVGHTFFMRPALADELEDIWRMEIEPYLEEYFFSQSDQVQAFRWEVVSKEVGAVA